MELDNCHSLIWVNLNTNKLTEAILSGVFQIVEEDYALTTMGLSNYPYAAEGVIPLIVMNTVMSVAILKNMFRSVLQAVGATSSSDTASSDYPTYISMFEDTTSCESSGCSRPRRVSITQYKSLCHNNNNKSVMLECCVCLTGFEANQEVSELPCKHFFHTSCLDKWFDNWHTTCPLCRSFS